MRKQKTIFGVLLLILAMALAACNGDDDAAPQSPSNGNNANTDSQEVNENETERDGNDNNGNEGVSNEGGIDGFLQQVNNNEAPLTGGEDRLDYGLGYLLYYAPAESTGLDNLIYNALVVHKQLYDSDIAEGVLSNGQQNLLDITDGITFDPNVEITEQIGQTPEVREAIMARLTADQQSMLPEAALASNEVSGIIAVKSREDIGRKYLVYTQDTPDSEFEFLGVILVVDASGQPLDSGESYSFQGWDSLPLLGDASGPFWNEIPAGVSGDPTNTDEGRPGVLLISEGMYEDITS